MSDPQAAETTDAPKPSFDDSVAEARRIKARMANAKLQQIRRAADAVLAARRASPRSITPVTTGLPSFDAELARGTAQQPGLAAGKVYVIDGSHLETSMTHWRLLPQLAQAAAKTEVCVAIVSDGMRANGQFSMLEPVYVRGRDGETWAFDRSTPPDRGLMLFDADISMTEAADWMWTTETLNLVTLGLELSPRVITMMLPRYSEQATALMFDRLRHIAEALHCSIVVTMKAGEDPFGREDQGLSLGPATPPIDDIIQAHMRSANRVKWLTEQLMAGAFEAVVSCTTMDMDKPSTSAPRDNRPLIRVATPSGTRDIILAWGSDENGFCGLAEPTTTPAGAS
ncbi:MAG: hypothetical protein ACHREM_02185 [Polyangiales bacterium]